MTLSISLNAAAKAFYSGELENAENLCRSILSEADESSAIIVSASHLLGLVLFRAGDPEQGVAWLTKALPLSPNPSVILTDLGVALEKLGRFDEAAETYATAVALNAEDATLWYNYGIVLGKLQRDQEAIAAYLRAVVLRPEDGSIYYNLGLVLQDDGQLSAAVAAFRRAVDFLPSSKTMFHLAFALHLAGYFEEAVSYYDKSIALDPGGPAAYCNRGAALSALGRHDEALKSYEQAVAIYPDYPEALSNLGGELAELDRFEDARECIEHAIRVAPSYGSAWCNLGNVLLLEGRLEEALVNLRHAVSIAPNMMEVRHNLAIALMMSEQWKEGLVEYESRLSLPGNSLAEVFALRPQWDGQPMPGKTLLVVNEQGHGDVIQFCRFLPWAAERVGRVIFICNEALLRSMFGAFPGVTAVSGGLIPEHDVSIAILSLPKILGIEFKSIPQMGAPYLHARPELIAAWRERLAPTKRLKIGLVWAGNPGHKNDHRRSLSLDFFLSLPWPPEVIFFSLQKGEPAGDIARLGAERILVDLASEIGDFADLAALMAELDLIISVDSAPAHLAGALGRPVWMLLPYVADWRWGTLASPDTATTTRWYPTMRLYRQPVAGDWQSVLQQVGVDLVDLVKEHSALLA